VKKTNEGNLHPEAGSDSWCTSEQTSRELGRFGTDPCSNPRSLIESDIAYSLEAGNDGLVDEWIGSVFANFPYSDPFPWCERLAAYEDQWCALAKLDTTTKWWHVLMDSGAQWAPFRKREKFRNGKPKGCTANFASVLVYHNGWQPSAELAARLWMPPGRRATDQLRIMVAMLDRVGGFMTAADQIELRAAREILEAA
jgi:hypothetical protein